MKAQEIFDRVYRHLIAQKAKAKFGAACVYRATDGKSCAVGCLISDEDYQFSLEGKSPSDLSRMPSFEWMRSHTNLLTNLQVIHDEYPVATWADSLKQLALMHKLQVPE